MTSKKIAVFGPSDMLGRAVMDAVRAAGHEAVPMHRTQYELQSQHSIRRALELASVDGVINCCSVLPNTAVHTAEMVLVNSLFPHVLAMAIGGNVPLLLVSSDRVFSGKSRYRYVVESAVDPRDYYGKSKAMGEVIGPNIIVVRCAFVGCDSGFMRWVLDSEGRGSIDGWVNSLWTGSTVDKVAASMVELLFSGATGLVHLATEHSISKFDIAHQIINRYGLDLRVNPVYYPTLNRSLSPSPQCVLDSFEVSLNEYYCPGNHVAHGAQVRLRENNPTVNDQESTIATGSSPALAHSE